MRTAPQGTESPGGPMAGKTRWICHDCFHGMRPEDTAGGIVVVIDVLRASTTIVTALANGAAAVRTAATREAAVAAARGETGGEVLLGGERGGLRIPGFDLGNSPREYARDRVAGRTIVSTTTNGTAAIAACPRADEILVGALVNRRAAALVARGLAAAGAAPRAIHLVCAGTDGSPTEEDLLAAGAILDAAGERPDEPSAARALAAFRDAAGPADPDPARLAAALHASRGGVNLRNIGLQDDVEVAAAIDSLPVVPRLDRAGGRFVIEGTTAR